MEKILVTTDFSAHSKAAMRFAFQVAAQSGVALTFLHVSHIPRPTSWTDASYNTHVWNLLDRERETLSHFVELVRKGHHPDPIQYTCVVKNSPFVDSTIMTYAADHAFDYICISTRGAGLYEKLFGTTTSNLINQSPVPVLAVPGTYRTSKVMKLLYASDLSRLSEIKQVVDFARPLSATVELLHIAEPGEPAIDTDIINVAVQKQTDYPVAVQLHPRLIVHTLTDDINRFVDTHKPSVLVMFTTQSDGFFARMFRSGNSIDYSFLTTIPLLVFSKT